MKKGLLQEKFQRTMERSKREDREWATFESQRRVVTEKDSRSYDVSEAKKQYASGASFSAPIVNHMPPGMNVGNQKLGPKNSLANGGLAGSTDESNSVNASMLKKGYQRQSMKPEDEMYNDEHQELFYGTAEVDGDTGFCERNNYLDRT